MADTPGRCQVDFTDPMRAEEDSIMSISATRTDGDPFAKKRLTDRPRTTLELNVGLRRADLPPDVLLIPPRPHPPGRQRSWARPVSIRRHRHVQSLVCPFIIIDG